MQCHITRSTCLHAGRGLLQEKGPLTAWARDPQARTPTSNVATSQIPPCAQAGSRALEASSDTGTHIVLSELLWKLILDTRIWEGDAMEAKLQETPDLAPVTGEAHISQKVIRDETPGPDLGQW